MTVTAPNAPSFFTAAADTRRCMRCSRAIRRTNVLSKNKKDGMGLYSMLAQVLSDDKLTGGMLCKKCVKSFRSWMEEEKQDDD